MRRILVFQPDATTPPGAALPVGVVREDGLVPTLWILVKATFGFSPPEPDSPPPLEATLLATQESISFERRIGELCDAERAPDAVVVPTDAAIELEDGHTVRLPGIAPSVRIDGGGRPTRVVALTCDSLWIDDIHQRLVALWRGQVPIKTKRAREIERITVSLEQRGAPLSTVRRPRLACYSFAIEADGELASARDEVERARLTMALLREAGRGPVEPSIELAHTAVIAAELAEQTEPEATTLRRHKLDPLDWTIEEQAWFAKIGNAQREGDGSLSAAYGEAFLAAQDRLGKPEESRFSLAHYIEIRAHIEAGGRAAPKLAEHHMTLPAWMRLDRRWKREGLQNPDLEEELSRLVREAQGQDPRGGA